MGGPTAATPTPRPTVEDGPAPGGVQRASFAAARAGADTSGQFNPGMPDPSAARFNAMMGPQAEPGLDAIESQFKQQNTLTTPESTLSMNEAGGTDWGQYADLAQAGMKAGMALRPDVRPTGIPNPGPAGRFDSSRYGGQRRPIGRF
jgi:hypothetical protein